MEDQKTQGLIDILITIRDVVYERSKLPTLYSNDEADKLTMYIASVIKLNEELFKDYDNINFVLDGYKHDFEFGNHSLTFRFGSDVCVGIKLREENGEAVFALFEDLAEFKNEFGEDQKFLNDKERDIVKKIATKLVDDVLNFDKSSSLLAHKYQKGRTEEDRITTILQDGVDSYRDFYHFCQQTVFDPEHEDDMDEAYKTFPFVIGGFLFNQKGLEYINKNTSVTLNIEEFDFEKRSDIASAFKDIFDDEKEQDLRINF